jgi:hypothetical protein
MSERCMNPPIALRIDGAQLEALLARVKAAIPEDYESVKGMADTIRFLCEYIQKKNASIRRLLGIVFGAKTEKTSEVLKDDDEGQGLEPEGGEASESEDEDETVKKPRKGHGRKGGVTIPARRGLIIPTRVSSPGVPVLAAQEGRSTRRILESWSS